MMRERVELRQGTNRRAEREAAWIESVTGSELVILTENFPSEPPRQVFLTGETEGKPYFFAAPVIVSEGKGRLRLALPAVVYLSERRDRTRRSRPTTSTTLLVSILGRHDIRAQVANESADGLGIEVRGQLALAAGAGAQLRFLTGSRAGEGAYGEVRHSEQSPRRAGWTRIGLAVLPSAPCRPVEIERWDALPQPRGLPPNCTSSQLGRSAAAEVVTLRNAKGEEIRALVDWCGDRRGAPAVIIPPAWGKTKETLLPLAETLIETFRAARQSLVVVRFDGIRRRGESYNDVECRRAGEENLHYTFSQGYRDILATLDFLERAPQYRCERSILVTFSVASIEGRRAAVVDRGRRIGAWISVVGASDPQSLLRVISGGIDYMGGADRGISFGLQHVQGLLLDMDGATKDALEQRIAFLDDARRDMAKLTIPVTWLHGRFDGWMDLERIRHALSFGDTMQRRLLELPIGHQLKDSREALGVFGVVAQECARLLLGRELDAIMPEPSELKQRRIGEVARLRRADIDLQKFWKDYLVGRDGFLGIELVMWTKVYRELMAKQLEALALRPGDRVIDLGCGVGALPWFISSEKPALAKGLRIVGLDFVREALVRARDRLETLGTSWAVPPRFVLANLDLVEGVAAPLRPQSADAVLASLLLNYLKDPLAALRGAFELLRPGGRLVASSLRRDADVSRICVDSVEELRSGRAREAFGKEGEERLGEALRGFINDAGLLLDLEERGHFHFWDGEEAVELAAQAGFQNVSVEQVYGHPPQALLLYGERPSY
jgi:ubiquinone/menaquinone biosynthesis C-methylase UbiE